jgi:pimeloyl-ACP methyl ester carboxylesterase
VDGVAKKSGGVRAVAFSMMRLIPVTWLLATSILAAKSPESKFATVNGARLEYLDWGGEGPVLLFLAGLGGTAHIFNDLAPDLISNYHCIGLTRRGFGQSEQTPGGYELDSLVLDIALFARSLGLRDLTLVGHSYGGTEAVRASELHPELIRRVILLDTAYDPIPSAAPPAESKLFAAVTRMTQAERMSSLDSYRTYEKRLLGGMWSDALEADLRETIIVGKDGSIGDRTPGRVSRAIVGERAQGKWNITKIPGPALLIFAQHSWTDLLPGLELDEATTAQITKAGAMLEAARRSQIEAFRRDSPLARIVELEHTDHHCFIQRRERVADEMRKFLAESERR